MIFKSKSIIIGNGRVSSVTSIKDGDTASIIVVLSEGGALTKKCIDDNLKVSVVKPIIFSYADDAYLYNGGVVERYGGVLQIARDYM